MNENTSTNNEVLANSISNNENTSLTKNNERIDYTNLNLKQQKVENNGNDGYYSPTSSSEKNITLPFNNSDENDKENYSSSQLNENKENIDQNIMNDEENNNNNMEIKGKGKRRPSILSRIKKTTKIITKCLNFNLPLENINIDNSSTSTTITTSTSSTNNKLSISDKPIQLSPRSIERRYSVAPTLSHAHHFTYSQTQNFSTTTTTTINESTFSSSSSSSTTTTTLPSSTAPKLLPNNSPDQSMPDISLQPSSTTSTITSSSISTSTSCTTTRISCCSSKKLTIVIDLDETLIHSKFPQYQEISEYIPCSFSFNMTHKINNLCKEKTVCVWIREGLEAFLNDVATFANVIIFTASLSDYANPLIDILDPEKKLITGRLYRDSLSAREGKSDHRVKDLTKILLENNQCLDLSKTVIIDNTATNFVQYANAVLVPSFFPQKTEVAGGAIKPDKTLAYLAHLLKRLSEEDDVREYLAELRNIKQKAIEVRRNSEPVIQSMFPSRIQI